MGLSGRAKLDSAGEGARATCEEFSYRQARGCAVLSGRGLALWI
jgi:hypothetical protein